MRQIFYLIMLGHAKVTFVQLVDKSRTNVTMMTGNPAFATPTPPLVDITASADRLDRAIQAYDFSHSRLDKEERDNAFVELKGLRTDLGSYVQSIANGNQAIMTSAGFATRKQPQPMGRLSAPANVRATALPYPGQVEVRFDGVRGRQNYQIYICAGDPSVAENWTIQAITGKNRVVVEGLETDHRYYFRVEALGAAGASPLSNSATAKAA
jgi:hypothetical protein